MNGSEDKSPNEGSPVSGLGCGAVDVVFVVLLLRCWLFLKYNPLMTFWYRPSMFILKK